MAKKRVTRKELVKEPDEFITLTGRAIQWARQNKRQMIYGVCGFFALVVLMSVFGMIRDKREKAAAALLSQSLSAFEAAGGQGESEKSLASVKPDLERLISEYGGQPEGRLGRVFYGHLVLENGTPDEAIGLYKKALDDFDNDPTLANAVLNGLAMASLEKGDNASAIKYFEQMTMAGGTYLKDCALFHLGRLYRLAGEAEKSKKAFDRLGTDFPNSMFADIAREKSAG